MSAKNNKTLLWTEYILFFFGVPVFITYGSHLIHPSSILLPILIGILIYFSLNKNFRFKELIQLDIPKKTIWVNCFLVIITGILLLIGVMIFTRNNLFNLPGKNLRIWLLICILYPIFSAYIQEVIYRSFILLRYGSIFKNRWSFILASAISFSFVHIIYFSFIAIILTLVAGLYLAYIYQKTKSVLFSAMLHGAFGDIIFTIGMGQYFWFDMHKWL